MTASKRPNRSVIDYQTEEQLRRALLTSGIAQYHDGSSCDGSDRSVKRHIRTNHQVGVTSTVINIDESNDWVFTSYDPETTEAQSMKEELQRLQVLKSYLLLDSEREEIFERITRTAAKHFDVPIALVSLVDLGRQWFMSNRGLPHDVRETPRKHAFCAHAIKQKPISTVIPHDDMEIGDMNSQHVYPLLIVPDATLDFRFRNNPLVTGPPDIRFYAGAPLISPEGYKLGTLCVIDQKTRPEGLNEEQQETLRDLAAIVVQAMVDRRYRLESRASDPEKLIAYTAHDLMTPLTGIQLSLTMMKEDDDIMRRLGAHGAELLNTAASCADVMLRICQTSVEALRQTKTNTTNGSMPYKNADVPITRMDDLLSSLRMIMDPIQKKVPIIISVDQTVPPCIVADDLKLFRSALNLLSNAATRCHSGSIHLKIFLDFDELQHYRKRKGVTEQILIFECEDTGPDIVTEDYQSLFQSNTANEAWDVDSAQVGLSSVASLVTRMHGEYGFRPRGIRLNGEVAMDSKGRPYRGAIFWFWIPFHLPDGHMDLYDSHESTFMKPVHSTASSITGDYDDIDDGLFSATSVESNHSKNQLQYQKSMTETFALSGRRCFSYSNLKNRTIVPVDTAQQAVAINNSCLNAVFAPSIRNEGDRQLVNAPSSPQTSNLFAEILGRKTESTGQLNAKIRPEKQVWFQNSTWNPKEQRDANHHFPSTYGAHKALATFGLDSKLSSFSTASTTSSKSNGFTGKEQREYQPRNIVRKEPGEMAASTEPSTESSTSKRKRRALIIDDCGIIRKTLSRALSKQGYDVVKLAVDGMEGLQELKKDTFDIVLCDFLMPVMDGLDCVKQYREWEQENRSWFRQPIIGMSAHANVNDRGQGLEAGMDDFKPKPINMKTITEIQSSELCATISQQLDKKEGKQIDSNEPATQSAPTAARVRQVTLPPNKSDNHSTNSLSQMDDNDDLSSYSGKRGRQKPTPVCLMVSDTPTLQSNTSIALLEALGWGVVVVHDGSSALRLLQMRNWDIVLIDDDVSDVNDQSCIAAFREWEGHNRINVQKNVFLVCDGDIPSPRDLSSVVQPPSGCNGVLQKPVPWEDLRYLLERNGIASGMEIVIRH